MCLIILIIIIIKAIIIIMELDSFTWTEDFLGISGITSISGRDKLLFTA